jgi:hypothetical protein
MSKPKNKVVDDRAEREAKQKGVYEEIIGSGLEEPTISFGNEQNNTILIERQKFLWLHAFEPQGSCKSSLVLSRRKEI